MKRWMTIAAYAKRHGITENAARKRATRYSWLGTWERKLVKRKGRWVLAYRDLYWPKHPAHS